MTEWHEVIDELPPLGKTVLGWWDRNTVHSVVYTRFGRWNRPGHLFSDYYQPPTYWCDMLKDPEA